MKIKVSILEYLTRECAREVLRQINQINEALPDDETKGASAPPADGLGSADQPADPKSKDTRPEPPSEPETPPSPIMKGLIFVNPRNKARLQKIQAGSTEAELDRNLYKLGTNVLGMQRGRGLKVSVGAKSLARNTITDPNSTVYLYVGKLDPDSEELFLMADRSLQIAKDSSVPATEFGGAVEPTGFDPLTASPEDYAAHLASSGQNRKTGELEDEPDIDSANPSWERGNGLEENLRKTIKKIVNEMLDKKH